MEIYLLKNYQNYGSNIVIDVDDNVAETLISNGTARHPMTRDYLIKPQFGFKKIITRAFKRPPGRK